MNYREASHQHWNNTWTKYNTVTEDKWLDFFKDKIMSSQTPILDLGCGIGNDTFTLYNWGKEVLACDQSEVAIKSIQRRRLTRVEAMCVNMLDGLPFADNSFDIIIADLSLHYFNKRDTRNIVEEIKRVLKPTGYLLIRVNSINDTEHGAGKGKEIEHHVYSIDGSLKRFFDNYDIKEFFGDFLIEYINEESMSRYTKNKWVYVVCARNNKE